MSRAEQPGGIDIVLNVQTLCACRNLNYFILYTSPKNNIIYTISFNFSINDNLYLMTQHGVNKSLISLANTFTKPFFFKHLDTHILGEYCIWCCFCRCQHFLLHRYVLLSHLKNSKPLFSSSNSQR